MIGDEAAFTDSHAEMGILASVFRHGFEAIIKTEECNILPSDFKFDVNEKLFFVMNSILQENPKTRLDDLSIISKAK